MTFYFYAVHKLASVLSSGVTFSIQSEGYNVRWLPVVAERARILTLTRQTGQQLLCDKRWRIRAVQGSILLLVLQHGARAASDQQLVVLTNTVRQKYGKIALNYGVKCLQINSSNTLDHCRLSVAIQSLPKNQISDFQ